MLGDEELGGGEDFALTRRKDGTIVVLFWNYAHYAEEKNYYIHLLHGDPRLEGGKDIYDIFESCDDKTFQLMLENLPDNVTVRELIFDQQNGCAYDQWQKMGAPRSTTRKQEQSLRETAEMKEEITQISVTENRLTLERTLPRFGVRLVEIKGL